jgi:hypothetical protein
MVLESLGMMMKKSGGKRMVEQDDLTKDRGLSQARVEMDRRREEDQLRVESERFEAHDRACFRGRGVIVVREDDPGGCLET